MHALIHTNCWLFLLSVGLIQTKDILRTITKQSICGENVPCCTMYGLANISNFDCCNFKSIKKENMGSRRNIWPHKENLAQVDKK